MGERRGIQKRVEVSFDSRRRERRLKSGREGTHREGKRRDHRDLTLTKRPESHEIRTAKEEKESRRRPAKIHSRGTMLEPTGGREERYMSKGSKQHHNLRDDQRTSMSFPASSTELSATREIATPSVEGVSANDHFCWTPEDPRVEGSQSTEGVRCSGGGEARDRACWS